MGIKCLILLLPFSLVTYRVQVRALDFSAAGYSLKLCLFCHFFFSFIFHLVSPGTVSDADRRVGSGPPGHGSSFGVVPLPGDIPRSWRHPWTYTGDPSSITLPHNEGGFSENNKWGVFAWMVLDLSASFLALGILQSVDISSENHGNLPKRRGQCSAVEFWMIEFPSECAGMIRRLLCGCVAAYRLSSH